MAPLPPQPFTRWYTSLKAAVYYIQQEPLNPDRGKRFSSSKTSRPALGPSQPPIQPVSEFFHGVKAVGA